MDLTFNISNLLGANPDYRRTKVWLETNIPDDVIVDSSGNEIRFGTVTASVSQDGTGVFEGVIETNALTNPTGWQYQVHVDYPDSHAPKGRASWSSGWFSLPVVGGLPLSTDLADVAAEVYVPPTYSSTLMSQLDAHEATLEGDLTAHAASLEPTLDAKVTAAETARTGAETARTGAEAARDAAVDISGISTSDGVVEALVKNTGGAGPLTSAAVADAIASQVPAATTTTPGRVELATDAETATGTDAVRAVTPAAAAAQYAPLQVSGKGIARTVNRADYATLALAITAAGSGGTVFYPDGSTYDEPATTLSTTITLDARRATIRKSANGPLFTITGYGVRITKGLKIDGRGTVYTGATIVVTGNGTTQDCIVDANIVDSDGPCIDYGIGAGQRGKFRSDLAYTRERSVTDGVTTASSTTITSATAAFTSNDVGKAIMILGAWDSARSSFYLTTRIESVTNATTIVVLDAPQVTLAATTLKIHAPVVRYAAEQAAGVNGDRSITGVSTAGCVLADFGGAQTINVTDTNSAGVIFSSANCVKVTIGGSNRLATSGSPVIIRGTQHALAGGAMLAGDIVLETTSNSCVVGGNVAAGYVVDKGVSNDVYRSVDPTPPHTIDPRLLAGASTLNANQAIYMRVRSRGFISKIGLHVGVSSGNIAVAVYRNTAPPSAGRSARPNTRKATSGSVACPAAGYQEVALTSSVYVEEGDWFCLAADNATATFYRCATAGFSSDLNKGLSHFENSAFPPPATATANASGALFSVILVGVA